jgi:hypothetical protein
VSQTCLDVMEKDSKSFRLSTNEQSLQSFLQRLLNVVISFPYKYISNLPSLKSGSLLPSIYAGRHATLYYKIRALTRGDMLMSQSRSSAGGTFPKYINMTVHPLQNYSWIL